MLSRVTIPGGTPWVNSGAGLRQAMVVLEKNHQLIVHECSREKIL
jgi:hypothetical protein